MKIEDVFTTGNTENIKDINDVKIEDIINIVKDMDKNKIERTGFIAIYNLNGFDVYTIPEDRLRHFLVVENMRNNLKAKSCTKPTKK